jgi:hypothetical protein
MLNSKKQTVVKSPEVMEQSQLTIGEIIYKVIEIGAFFLGSILLFSKTSDLMTAFAPSQILGYTGIGPLYGMCCALMVEGLFVAMKFALPSSKSPGAWLWNIVLIIFPFGISALAQTIDSFVVQRTLADQSPTIRFLVQWGVPMIPALIVGLILAKSAIDNMPAEMIANVRRRVSDNVVPEERETVGNSKHPIPAEPPFTEPRQ